MIEPVAEAVEGNPFGVVVRIVRVVVDDRAAAHATVVGHRRTGDAKRDHVARDEIAIREFQTLDHEVFARESQPGAAAEDNLAGRLRPQSNRFGLSAVSDEQNVRVRPEAVLHDHRVARLRLRSGIQQIGHA